MRQLSNINAINRCIDVKTRKIHAEEADAILKKFREHHWLRFDAEDPTVRLHPRFIFEMEPYLKAE